MELSASKAAEIRALNRPVLILQRRKEYRVFALGSALLTIGKEHGCDLVLDNDKLEGRHAVIQPTDDGHEIFNLSSSKDTLRNGRQIEAAPLEHGDEIRLGTAFFTCIDPNADIMPAGFQLLSLPLEFLRSQAIMEAQQFRNTHDEAFTEIFLESLKRSPWILISGAIHGLIFAILFALMPPANEDERPINIEVELVEADEIDDAPIDDFEVEEVDPEVEEIDDPPEMAEDLEDDYETIDTEDESESDSRKSDLLEGLGAYRIGSGPGDGMGGLGRGSGIPVGAGETLRRKVRALQESGLEVVVLLDATGSMDAELGAAKQQIGNLIGSLNAMGIEFRLGVVAFRDKGEEYVTKTSPLTRYVYKSVAFLDQLSAVGGGDEPEAVLAAFKDAVRMRFARKAEKVLILVGDAPPKPQSTKHVLRVVQSFVAKGGHVHTIYTNSEPGNRDWSGTKKIFSRIAEAGHGRAVQLQNDNKLVADIMNLTLQAGSTQNAAKLLKQIESGPRAAQIRKRIKERNSGFVRKALLLRHINPQIPLEILSRNHEDFLPSYFAVLNEKELPLANRWLTTVLLRRLLEQLNSYHGIGSEASRLIAKYNPEAPFRKQQAVLAQLKKVLYDSGLLQLDATVEKKR